MGLVEIIVQNQLECANRIAEWFIWSLYSPEGQEYHLDDGGA